MKKRLAKKIKHKKKHAFTYDHNKRLYYDYLYYLIAYRQDNVFDIEKLRIHTLAKLH